MNDTDAENVDADQGQDAPQTDCQPQDKPKKAKKQDPQKNIDNFWDAFTTKYPGKVSTILPKNVYAKSKAEKTPKGTVHDQAASESYEQAKERCEVAVKKIARECRRVNMKYRDLHFDIDFDLKWKRNECLEGLGAYNGPPFTPNSVKRVPDIFDKPQFYYEDATASDVRQGNDGDCWFLSALCAISNKKGLIDKICVARDEKVGVYGFVFHRDGEWIQEIIDDKLYLSATDYDESTEEKFSWLQIFNRQDAEEEYRKAYQTGSRALYFAQCSNENETWLPLLEKAYAKAHGDFRAIYGGFTGEAIEDLTGGVTTELFTTDILDKEKFWEEEIMNVNDQFLFGAATGCFDDWKGGGMYTDRKGVVSRHAYSIMEAREVKGERLLRVRNPWGKTEWQGAWSDGSEQWTPEWMELLNHRFGNDGMFWISYKDLLRKYQTFDRTRLFGPEWTVTQQWTTIDVAWSVDYNDTKFEITTSKKGPVVIVLSQLDDRYFRGLEGQYYFSLHFRLEKEGEPGYIVRSHGNYLMNRSVSTDLDLEPGIYSVLMKISADRDPGRPTPEDTLRANCRDGQAKLLQIGLAYDLAHAKGQVVETDEEKKGRLDREQRKKATLHKQDRDDLLTRKKKEWLIRKKQIERERRHKQRLEEHKKKKDEAQKAEGLLLQPGNAGDVGQGSTNGAKGVTNDELIEAQTSSPTPQKDKENDNAQNPEKSVIKEEKGKTADKASGPDETTQAKIDKFNEDLKLIPSNQVNGTANAGDEAPAASMAVAHTTADHPDNASDAPTILSFNPSIDSDLDFDPVDEGTQTNDESATTPEGSKPEDAIDSDDEDFANDPWNAVCVVGLRVYSKDEGVSVKVVRPKNEDDDEDTPLDSDDPSKGISGQQEVLKTSVEGVNDVEAAKEAVEKKSEAV